ncbi:MAG: YkgJ family cysteine cluster protein [Desulfovibrio sp.]|jgi:Fe-S-cluster containining protein|nr:YkgJ family cysteine cluster protein [Desulfovibrio sp.]
MIGVLPDIAPFLIRYEHFAREADRLFERIRGQYPDLVTCRKQCGSCCHALFDLSLVEALYLNKAFGERFPEGAMRAAILDAAGTVDRHTARIKRKAFKESQDGKGSNDILAEMATLAVRCPLLDEEEHCLLYDARPVTCRLYGIPTAIGGKAYTCGKTGFIQGMPYPTVALDKMQGHLHSLSEELAAAIGSSYTQLAGMYVPVSTSLLTVYDAAYLGVGGISQEKD